MTWEQALAAVLAIGVTALARLVNKWLPPSGPGPVATAIAERLEPMAGPPKAEWDTEPTTGAPTDPPPPFGPEASP